MSEFTINGNTYREKELPNTSKGRYAMRYLGIEILAMSMLASSSSGKASPPNVNIITEFELIQQKKSNLSKSQRDWVVSQFNKRFELIQQATTI